MMLRTYAWSWIRVLGVGTFLLAPHSAVATTYDATGSNKSFYFSGIRDTGTGDYYQGNITFGGGLSLATNFTNTMAITGRFEGTLQGNGTLALNDHLVCGSHFSIAGAPAIQGCKFTMHLNGPFNLSSLYPLKISRGGTIGDVSHDTDISNNSGNLVIDGQGNLVTFLSDSSLIIDSVVSVTLRNMTLLITTPNPITMLASSSSLTLDNVDVLIRRGVPGANWNFSGPGNLSICNVVNFLGVGSALGNSTFTYSSPHPIGLESGANLTIRDGVNFYMNSGVNQAFYMTSYTSVLRFNNSTWTVPAGTGTTICGGYVIFENLVKVVNTGATSSAGGVIFGAGVSGNSTTGVTLLGGATVIVDGYLGFEAA